MFDRCVSGSPISRSISVLQKPAFVIRVVAGIVHVRKTRTMKCTVTGGLLQRCSL